MAVSWPTQAQDRALQSAPTLASPATWIDAPTIPAEVLAPISHKLVERNGGGSVRRLDSIEPYENTPLRRSADRL